MTGKITVMVVGAAGQIGKQLCGFLCSSDFVGKLILCDVAPTKGLEMELNHMDQGCVVVSQDAANCDSQIDCVLMPCGKPQTSANEKRDDLFKFNAKIFESSISAIASRTEKVPVFVIVGNPVNSLVVIAAETLKKAGKFNSKRILGLNELDALRAQRLVADIKGMKPTDVHVPFLGGHSEKTITPILTKVTNVNDGKAISLTKDEQAKIFDDVRFAGDRILAAYDNRGTATVSTAFSTFRLTEALFTEKHKDKTLYSYTEHGQMTKEVPKYMTAPFKPGNGEIGTFLPIKDLVDAMDADVKTKVFEELERNIKLALDTFPTLL